MTNSCHTGLYHCGRWNQRHTVGRSVVIRHGCTTRGGDRARLRGSRARVRPLPRADAQRTRTRLARDVGSASLELSADYRSGVGVYVHRTGSGRARFIRVSHESPRNLWASGRDVGRSEREVRLGPRSRERRNGRRPVRAAVVPSRDARRRDLCMLTPDGSDETTYPAHLRAELEERVGPIGTMSSARAVGPELFLDICALTTQRFAARYVDHAIAPVPRSDRHGPGSTPPRVLASSAAGSRRTRATRRRGILRAPRPRARSL